MALKEEWCKLTCVLTHFLTLPPSARLRPLLLPSQTPPSTGCALVGMCAHALSISRPYSPSTSSALTLCQPYSKRYKNIILITISDIGIIIIPARRWENWGTRGGKVTWLVSGWSGIQAQVVWPPDSVFFITRLCPLHLSRGTRGLPGSGEGLLFWFGWVNAWERVSHLVSLGSSPLLIHSPLHRNTLKSCKLWRKKSLPQWLCFLSLH